MRVSKLFSQIEKLPIPVNEDIVITTREAHTIQMIGDSEPLSITQLAAYSATTKSAASQMASKLTAKGFLVKRQSSHSNKEYELTLSSSGWDAYRAHEQFHGADYDKLVTRLSTFSLSQIATMSVLLEALESIMEHRFLDTKR